MNVFILGITGGTGSRIARLLIDQGHSVFGLFRHPNQVARLEQMGASAVALESASHHEKDPRTDRRKPGHRGRRVCVALCIAGDRYRLLIERASPVFRSREVAVEHWMATASRVLVNLRSAVEKGAKRGSFKRPWIY